MYLWERWTRRLTLWFYVLEKMTFSQNSCFYKFISALIWKGHDVFICCMYGTEGSYASQEKLCYIICYLKRNNCILKTTFIVCLLLKRIMTTSLSPLITLFCITFLWTFIYLTRINLYQFSMDIFCWWAFILLHAFIKLNVWLFWLVFGV